MWLIFLGSSIAVALAALLVIWIGSAVLRSIRRKDEELENEILNKKEYRK